MKQLKIPKYRYLSMLIFAAVFGLIGFIALRDSKAATSADFNSDGTVNIIDLSILGTNYSKTSMTFNKGDANGDGTVNIIDLSILGSQWGTNPGADTTAPSVPTGLTANGVSSSQINLSWNASTDNVGVTQYIISRDGTQIATVNAPTTTYSNTGLSASTTYNYTVRARDAAGNMSANSAQVSGSTQTSGGGGGSYTIPVSGTISASSLQSQINSAPAGAVTVGPASGQSSFTITGNISINRANVTIDKANIPNGIDFNPGANGSSLTNSSAYFFNIFGADDVTLKGNTFDGQCKVNNNIIYDRPGQVPDRFRIQNNTIRNYCNAADSSAHTEGIYLGYSTNGLIEGNTFTHNGSTSHIFFTWWGEIADPAISYPRSICVRNNTFGNTHTAYYAFNFREEIPLSSNIAHENNNTVSGGPSFTTHPAFTRSCINPIPSNP